MTLLYSYNFAVTLLCLHCNNKVVQKVFTVKLGGKSSAVHVFIHIYISPNF